MIKFGGIQAQAPPQAEEEKDWDAAVHTGVLDLSGRCLPHAPSYLHQCAGLRHLDLSYNALHALEDCLDTLQALTFLDLSYNKLEELPVGLGNLDSLVTLKASFNQLQLVPHQVSRLGNLQTLHLNDNALSKLPAALGELAALTSLHLHFNTLHALPSSLTRLTALTELNLTGNPMCHATLASTSSGVQQLLTLAPHSELAQAPDIFLLNGGAASSTLASLPEDECDKQIHQPMGAHQHFLRQDSHGLIDVTNDGEINIVGPQTVGPNTSPPPEYTAEAPMISDPAAEISDLPPAAAAVLYRTLTDLTVGVGEVRSGRPLSASSSGRTAAGARLPIPGTSGAERRHGSGSGGGSSSSSMQRMTTAERRYAGGSSSAGGARPLSGMKSGGSMRVGSALRPGSASQSSGIDDGAASFGYSGSGEAAASLTFPLVAGMRSMMRRTREAAGSQDGSTGSGCSTPKLQPQSGTHSAEGGKDMENSLSRWMDGSSNGLDPKLELVARMLADRNPDLLESFYSSLASEEKLPPTRY